IGRKTIIEVTATPNGLPKPAGRSTAIGAAPQAITARKAYAGQNIGRVPIPVERNAARPNSAISPTIAKASPATTNRQAVPSRGGDRPVNAAPADAPRNIPRSPAASVIKRSVDVERPGAAIETRSEREVPSP